MFALVLFSFLVATGKRRTKSDKREKVHFFVFPLSLCSKEKVRERENREAYRDRPGVVLCRAVLCYAVLCRFTLNCLVLCWVGLDTLLLSCVGSVVASNSFRWRVFCLWCCLFVDVFLPRKACQKAIYHVNFIFVDVHSVRHVSV